MKKIFMRFHGKILSCGITSEVPKGTLMHVAIDRNDIALAQLALTAGVDLTIRNAQHDGDAMGRAMHLNRPEITRLIGEQTSLP